MKVLQSNPFPTLNSEQLRLRKPSQKDAPAYHEVLSCPELTKYSDLPPKPTTKRSERFVSWMSKLHSRGNGIAWIIEHSETEALLGAIRINSIEKKASCGMIGYELHPNYWGKGYATEALKLVAAESLTTLALNRLEAWTVVGNHASDRVLEKCGFMHEGVQREKARFNGELHTINLYSRLASDPVP